MIISPISVSNALVLISQAAGGRTYEELKNGLHLTGNRTTVADQFLTKYRQLYRGVGRASFSVANRVYVQQGYELNKSFKSVAIEKFWSGIESVDFANKDDTARIINDFVATKTKNKIQNLIKANMLNSATRVVLVNAIHFKAQWKIKFNVNAMLKGDFYNNGNEMVSVDFMTMEEYFTNLEIHELNAKVLEMRYLNSTLSMIFILPNQPTGLSALETKLKHYGLTRIADQIIPEYNDNFAKVHVRIPKFNIQFEIELKDALKNVCIRSFSID